MATIKLQQEMFDGCQRNITFTTLLLFGINVTGSGNFIFIRYMSCSKIETLL